MWSYWPIVEALSSIYDALVRDTPLDYFGARNYVPMYRQPATYGIRKGRRPLSYHTSELLVCIQIDGIIRLQIQEQKMYIRYKVYTEWYIKVDDVRFFVFFVTILFISSVRSSISHPDLFVIQRQHHPTFSDIAC